MMTANNQSAREGLEVRGIDDVFGDRKSVPNEVSGHSTGFHLSPAYSTMKQSPDLDWLGQDVDFNVRAKVFEPGYESYPYVEIEIECGGLVYVLLVESDDARDIASELLDAADRADELAKTWEPEEQARREYVDVTELVGCEE